MATRKLTFDDLPAPEIELDAEWSIDKFEEISIRLEAGWEQVVINRYMEMARAAMKQIEFVVQLHIDNADPFEWAKELKR